MWIWAGQTRILSLIPTHIITCRSLMESRMASVRATAVLPVQSQPVCRSRMPRRVALAPRCHTRLHHPYLIMAPCTLKETLVDRYTRGRGSSLPFCFHPSPIWAKATWRAKA